MSFTETFGLRVAELEFLIWFARVVAKVNLIAGPPVLPLPSVFL